MTDPLVRVEGLQLRRGSFELNVPTWEVTPGEVVGVVGPNGAGKTTLLEAIAGLLPLDQGSVRVFGLDPRAEPVAVRQRLGLVAIATPVFDVRIGELIRIVSGYYPTWDGALAAELADTFGLDLRKRASKISTGQGMRLRLLLALAFRPQLLLLDEPTTGLDLVGRRQLMDAIGRAVESGEDIRAGRWWWEQPEHKECGLHAGCGAVDAAE